MRALHQVVPILLGVVACPALSMAQPTADAARTTSRTLGALNRFESFTPADPFADASPADADLGEQLLLTQRQRYRPFSLGAGYGTTWTSNAFYTPDNPQSDVFMNAFAQAIALPYLGNNFFLDLSANVGGYRYFRNPTLDFDSLATVAGVLKVFREFWDVGIYARHEFSLLWAPRGGDTLLSEQSLVAGMRKTFQFSRAHALFLAAEADFAVGGWPEYALAHEFSFYAVHQVEWTRMFNTSLFYQLAVYDFRHGGRVDSRNYIGASAGLKPLKWLTVSASAWLGWNASNETEYDFFVANLGGAINASINF